MYTCAYVRAHVMSVTLRNVNLRSCLGTQVSLIYALHKVVETMFLGDRGRGENSKPGPSLCTYLVESSSETSAERS